MNVTARPAGDRALLLELADNDAATRVAARARRELNGVVDVVPGHCTVLVTLRRPTGSQPGAGGRGGRAARRVRGRSRRASSSSQSGTTGRT